MQILLIVKLTLCMWVITSWLSVFETEFTTRLNNTKSTLLKMFWSIVICPKCFSFWMTLFLTLNFYNAAAVSLLITFIELVLKNKTTKL